jgi:YfiH family protein
MLSKMLIETTHDGIRLLAEPEAPALVRFTDRHGGVSEAPYDTLNLAARVGDDLDAVAENRARAAAACEFDLDALALARQVHGIGVLEVERGQSGVIGEADVLVTRAHGVVLGVLTADCAPVLLAGADGVAVVHAGWRGLAGGVVERGVEALGRVDGAYVGPCIHACCYEVGAEVVDAFRARGLPVAGNDRVDIGRAATVALRHAGVDRIVASDECTSCETRYFSYRRDGITGRQGAFIGML